MSAAMRLKIACPNKGDEDLPPFKFIYVIDSPATTSIESLIIALQKFLVTQLDCHDTQLVHVVTDDGYHLMKHYICGHVLNNNEKITCIEMNQFIAENRNTFDMEEAWFKVEQYDASDDIEKSVTVGLNNTGKLYLYLFGGTKMQGLYLFRLSELYEIVRDKNKKINESTMKISQVSPAEWFLSAQWEHDPTSNNSLFLVSSLKTGGSTEVRSDKIRVILNESMKQIEKGEIIALSKSSQEDGNQNSKQIQTRLDVLKMAIPPPNRTGPVLDTNVPTTQIQKYEDEGDSSLRISQGNESYANIQQDVFEHTGHCRHFVTISDIIISKKSTELPEILSQKRSAPAEKPISISQVSVQYQRQDGKWIDCQDAKIELTSAQQDGGRKIVTSILNIEPNKLVAVSIHASLRVKGQPNRNNVTRSRAHRSLPQPLKLKIILKDGQTKTRSLVVEQINDPLEIITEETFLTHAEGDISKLIAFVYADDCESDERIYIATYIDQNNHLIIGDGGRSVTIDKAVIRTMQFNAKKNGTTEELIDFICTSDKKITSLFDPETFLFYGIRIELTTTTSKTIETIILPLDSIK